MTSIFSFLFLIMASVANSSLVWIQNEVTLSPLEIDIDDQFGWTASMDGNKLAVGAYSNDGEGGGYGAVYTFQWNGTAWIKDNQNILSPAVFGDAFSNAISLSGNKMAIGAYVDDNIRGTQAGIVYTYQWNGTEWVKDTSVLLPIDIVAFDYFGDSLSMNGDKLAVSSTSHNETGTVFTYQWNGTDWLEDSEVLAPSSLSSGDKFGNAVTMSGNKLAVSTIVANANAGKVYTYQWNGTNWIEDNEVLAPSSLLAGDNFGWSITMDGDKLAVSAKGDDGAGNNAGVVYTYQWNGTNWLEDSEVLAPSSLLAGDNFGWSIAMDGNNLAVGANGDNVNAGIVYTYQWNGTNWVQNSEVLAPLSLSPGDKFGNAVTVSGDKLAVGANGSDNSAIDAGIVYTFEQVFVTQSPTMAPTTLQCPACLNNGICVNFYCQCQYPYYGQTCEQVISCNC